MKFTCHIDINKPIHELVDLFNNPDNLKEWQDGFQRLEHLSGTPGQKGAISNLYYIMRGKEEVIQETLISMNLPSEMSGTYVHRHMSNTMQVEFEAIDEENTRYINHIHYTELNGFMIKLMAKLMPGMFKKQVQKWQNQFKAFAEGV